MMILQLQIEPKLAAASTKLGLPYHNTSHLALVGQCFGLGI